MTWLLKSKDNLLRMRQELWFTEAEIAIVDRGIAALDNLLVESPSQIDDRPGRRFAHHHASDANGIQERKTR